MIKDDKSTLVMKVLLECEYYAAWKIGAIWAKSISAIWAKSISPVWPRV